MQGGTRSGKTYNILIWYIIKLLNERDKVLSIVRQSLPSIRGTVMRDFIDILDRMGLYKEENHNKTENVYMLGTNIIEFVSIDSPQKIRGRTRNYCFINEGNELSYDGWLQLVMRTKEKVVIDYNPSDTTSWIYDHVIPRNDADFHITTYRDNPFLDKDIVDEIERLQQADENYWRVYGLGQRGVSQNMIYTHWKPISIIPHAHKYCYGLDFGFRNETALVKVLVRDGACYVQEMLYERGLTMDDLVARLHQLEVSKRDVLWCDSAEPKSIEHIRRMGFNAKGAVKKESEGIRKVQSMPLFLVEGSHNLVKEIKSYKWQTVSGSDGKFPDVEKPVKLADHAMDAMRMAIHSETSKKMLSWV
jgi:phage terminase large subunit